MSTAASWSRERVRLLDQEHRIRVATILFVCVFLFLGRPLVTDPTAAISAVALMSAFLLVSRFGIHRSRLASPHDFQLSAIAMAVLDLVAVTLLVRGTGGASSGFFPLYLLCLVFAAAFFRGLEVALLTVLACALFSTVAQPAGGNLLTVWHLSSGLGALLLVAWYSYALSEVLHGEKHANDLLLRNLTEGVLVLDSSNRVVAANPPFASMFGISERAILGRRVNDLAALSAPLEWVVADASSRTFSAGRSARSAQFPEVDLPMIEVNTIPCGESDGLTGGWVVVCRDLRDQLEPTDAQAPGVCDQVSPLANLRALSHALYDLADGLDDDERLRALSLIEEHTIALRSLIADILQTGDPVDRTYPSLRCVDAGGMLTSTRRLLEIQRIGDQARIDIEFPDDLPILRADRSQLGRCLLLLSRCLLDLAQPGDNLLLAAHAEENSIVFDLKLLPFDGEHIRGIAPQAAEATMKTALSPVQSIINDHGGRWEIRSCTDACCWIAVSFPLLKSPSATDDSQSLATPEQFPAALSGLSGQLPLAQEDRNELNNILGAIRGYAELALSTQDATRIARALAAAISLSDAAAELTAPDHKAAREATTDTEPQRITPQVPGTVLQPSASASESVILIVDDQESVRLVLADIFRSAGYETVTCAGGASALAFLEHTRPSIAFVDLIMPSIDGRAVVRAIRRLHPGVPVVVMTGAGIENAISSLFAEAPDAVIGKPFSVAEVLALAQRAVHKSSRTAAA